MVHEHVPRAEAAGVAAAPPYSGDQHDNKDHHEDHHHHADDGVTGVVIVVVIVIAAVPAAVGDVVGAVFLRQLGGPVGVAHLYVHFVAVVQIGGGDGHAVLHRHAVSAADRALGKIAGQPGGVVPDEGHLADPGLVEPPGGVVVGHIVIVNIVIVLNNAVGAELIHILLHPRVGEGKRLVRLVGAVKIDIHIAVIEVQPLDVVRQCRHVPDGAVGYADLQLLTVGQLLQRRPLQLHGDKQAAILRVGRHHNAVLLDVVVIRPCGGGKANRRQ